MAFGVTGSNQAVTGRTTNTTVETAVKQNNKGKKTEFIRYGKQQEITEEVYCDASDSFSISEDAAGITSGVTSVNITEANTDYCKASVTTLKVNI